MHASIARVAGINLPLRLIALFHVLRIPQAQLAHSRVEAQLEHVTAAVGFVLASAMPNAVMQRQQRARLADHGDLPAHILVGGHIHLVDAAEVTAWQQQRPAHLQRHIVREVHQLNIKMRAQVDDGVGV